MRGRSRSGFTLVEVLLAVGIFLTAGLTLAASFRSGMVLQKRLDEAARLSSGSSVVLQKIAAEFENAICYDLSGVFPDKSCFAARSGEIFFIVPTGAGLKAVRYKLEQEDRAKVLIVQKGITTDRNVAITESSQTNEQAQVLVREETGLADYLQKDFDGAQRSIVLNTVAKDGLAFAFAKAVPADVQDPGALVWQDALPAHVLPPVLRISLEVRSPARSLILTAVAFNPAGKMERDRL